MVLGLRKTIRHVSVSDIQPNQTSSQNVSRRTNQRFPINGSSTSSPITQTTGCANCPIKIVRVLHALFKIFFFPTETFLSVHVKRAQILILFLWHDPHISTSYLVLPVSNYTVRQRSLSFKPKKACVCIA